MSIVNEMLSDPGLSAEDKDYVRKFLPIARSAIRAACHGKGASGLTNQINAVSLAGDRLGLDVSLLHKESPLLYALWVALLSVIRETLRREDYKFQSLDAFLVAYGGRFDNESDNERINLLNTANWMNFLFKIIPARKNKGLAIHIVPKIVEGWDAKYVTGSGQTKATQNRVFIFETEGNTKANQRGKTKLLQMQQQLLQEDEQHQQKKKAIKMNNGGKRTAAMAGSSDGNTTAMKRRIVNSAPDQQLVNSTFAIPIVPIMSRQTFPQRVTRSSSGRILNGGVADGLDISSHGGETDTEPEPEKLHKGVKRALKVFTALGVSRDESIFGLGKVQRNDSISLNAGGLSANPSQQLTGPSDYQRGYTWTEVDPTGTVDAGNELQPQVLPYQMLPPVGLQSQMLPPDAPPPGAVVNTSVPVTNLGPVGGDTISNMFAGYT